MGALLDWLITQPSRMWPDLLASVAAGDWRYAVEISEDEDGPDIVFVLEIQVDAGSQLAPGPSTPGTATRPRAGLVWPLQTPEDQGNLGQNQGTAAAVT
jgi:hypothetical protein